MSDDKIIPFKTSINPVTQRPRIEMPPIDPALAERVQAFLNKALKEPREVEWFALLHLLEETMLEMIRLKGVGAVEAAVGRQLDAGWAALEGAEKGEDGK